MKKDRISLLAMVIFMFSLFSTNAFAISDDHVLSQNIREADGTSGQDTNSGSGIKTGHIQDGAVTDAKITGPISGSKLGNHTHSGSDIVDGTITNSKIATEAITPDKIGFYRNVIIVASSGGDFTNPVDAMNAITDASETNPYLVKIMPGIYNIGSNTVQMKPYVDIEGSGEKTTKITGNIAGTSTGVVRGASNAELRFLTVENTGGVSNVVAVYNGYASLKITNVTIIALGGNTYNYGVINEQNSSVVMTNVTVTGSCEACTNITGVYTSSSSSIVIKNVTISASGGASDVYGLINGSYSSSTVTNSTITVSGSSFVTGVRNSGYGTPSITVMNVVITATGSSESVYGIESSFGTVKLDNSMITGKYSILNYATTYVGNTKLDGVVFNGGALKCVGVYNGNYNPYTCPQ